MKITVQSVAMWPSGTVLYDARCVAHSFISGYLVKDTIHWLADDERPFVTTAGRQ